MNLLISQINQVKSSNIKELVNKRLEEFANVNDWFSELCFCILTANSKASTALKIQSELDFLNASEVEIKNTIIRNHHRFHNNKTKYIILAKKYSNIKEIINKMDEFTAREWLVKNIKGLGFKESSHFLRNVGHTNIAILDRHILRLLYENGLISEVPKTLTKKKYYTIEKIMIKLGEKIGLNQAELDLYMWYMKTGKILK